ncbi:hypothetical protein PHYSODRAFT_326843 [Phytophthora sojae]|uniref:Ataxin-10 domain-containing protein n=1 Tax=Phytophthora sojae (strain P6497) TaxID=1094619 RepID=G4Z0M9_PHYSP|nr:hypothetical protein PHYSODRAFT_326843 [Phytophthora sojae]EGZ25878.1 hypothetical protein PHYSODRAFT_326843 [Phytophthora sojae]|eukprot:XP_009521166.1 hypothetical protein PHYSODRAFT_326843 [Phytophthora sojae]
MSRAAGRWAVCAAGPCVLLGRLCCWAVCAAGPCVLLTPGHLLLGYVRYWDVCWVTPVRSRGVWLKWPRVWTSMTGAAGRWAVCAAGPCVLLGRLCCWAVCAAGPCVLLTPGHLLLGYVRYWDVCWVTPVRSRGVWLKWPRVWTTREVERQAFGPGGSGSNPDMGIKRIVLLAQVALRFCVNCVTNNDKNQGVAWGLFFPDDFQKIWVECHKYRKVVAFTVTLILNCVNSSITGSEDLAARRVDLVCARNLVITILHRCMVKPAKSMNTDEPTQSGPRIDDQGPAFELICTLFGVLFRDGRIKDLYNAVGAHMLSKLWSRVTPEQLTMWAVSSTKTAAAGATQEGTGKNLPLPDGTFEYEEGWIELENEAKLMDLDVLGELTVGHNKLDADVARELLLSLLQELQRVWELGRQNPTSRNTRAAGTTSHLDLVREQGYLPLFLNHCNIDETNPMIRERSLVALCNLCEGNEANQSYTNALRPQGMDAISNAVLEKAKMCADISEGGKVTLKKEDE